MNSFFLAFFIKTTVEVDKFNAVTGCQFTCVQSQYRILVYGPACLHRIYHEEDNRVSNRLKYNYYAVICKSTVPS